MHKTPKALRLHIGIFGKRNVGKSSIINALTHQNISIVSHIAGTTTDAVEKTMEMLPLGPVVFIDTAGIDDSGELGEKRIKKTIQIIDRCDIALIVCDWDGWGKFEHELYENFQLKKIPVLGIINKSDEKNISETNLNEIKKYIKNPIITSTKTDKDIVIRIKQELINNVPEEFINPPAILEGLVEKGDVAILVTPVDKEAPKGRLILPEAQVLRALLDLDCQTTVVQVGGLKGALENMKNPPKIVITDSQAFQEVSEIVPTTIPITSFSIVFARLKGDLKEYVKAVRTIADLKDGDKILISESCTHHQIEDDIAQVKLPRWLKNKTGKNLRFGYHSSHDFPEDVRDYKLIIQCGGCMTNRREILSRIEKAKAMNTPITNYGVAIAYCLDILDRAIEKF